MTSKNGMLIEVSFVASLSVDSLAPPEIRILAAKLY
jgi:hypothetical protein